MPDPAPRSRRARLGDRLGLSGLSSLRSALSTDFRGSTITQKAALVGVAVWLIYEWGPGNETLTPWILANIIGHNSGVRVIPITAAVGFVFTTVQQLASGFTALAGFSTFDRTARAAWDRLRGTTDVAPGEWSRLSWGARCFVVFGLGTTAVALIQIMTTGQVGVRRHASVVRASAVLCGALVAAIAAVAATVAFVGRRIQVLEGTTDWIIRILGNPLFWLCLLLVPALIRISIRRSRSADQVPAAQRQS